MGYASIMEKFGTMKRRVDCLIIEDQEGVCDVLIDYCEGLEFFRNIIVAKDGSVACSKLKNQVFGLILLDINLPKRDGFDILLDLERNKVNKIEDIVVVSGELDMKKLEKFLEKGVRNYLIKPFDQDSFLEKIGPVLNKKIAEQKLK